jgi:methionyl-tRNA formyltransferase
VNWAIMNGEPEIGVTAHWVDLGIDSGDIILQRSLPIARTDDYGSVLARVVAAIPRLAVEVAALLGEGEGGARAPRVPQEHALATYYGGRRDGDEWLDWSATSRALHDKIRAISRPGPGARTTLGDREVVIWRAWWEPWWPRYAAIPGQVVGRRVDGACAVKTGDSTLLVLEAQPEGGEPGVPGWRIGTRLGERDGVRALREEVRALRRRVMELERATTREVEHVSR